MGLSSSSTLADAKAQLNNNLGWEGSPTKAALALEAVRWILANRPARISKDGVASFDYESLANLEDKLSVYMKLHGGNVNRAAFTQGRPLI